MNNIIYFFILILIISYFYNRSEKFDSRKFAYLANKSKCFSCEREIINTLGPEYAWMGQPTKMVSAQLDAVDDIITL